MLLLGSLTAFAQRGGGNMTPEARAENQTKMMVERLGLSEEQQKQVYSLNLTRFQKMQELREAQNREGMRDVQEKFQQDMTALLTPEQQEKYKALAEEMRQSGGRGPRN